MALFSMNFIGTLSWALALVVSWPESAFLTDRFGMLFFEPPLRFAVSPIGSIAWLGLSTVIAAVSSLSSALKASKIAVREALAYE
jgi:putative ABC transport system permease protein